jgi:hypothetical protein
VQRRVLRQPCHPSRIRRCRFMFSIPPPARDCEWLAGPCGVWTGWTSRHSFEDCVCDVSSLRRWTGGETRRRQSPPEVTVVTVEWLSTDLGENGVAHTLQLCVIPVASPVVVVSLLVAAVLVAVVVAVVVLLLLVVLLLVVLLLVLLVLLVMVLLLVLALPPPPLDLVNNKINSCSHTGTTAHAVEHVLRRCCILALSKCRRQQRQHQQQPLQARRQQHPLPHHRPLRRHRRHNARRCHRSLTLAESTPSERAHCGTAGDCPLWGCCRFAGPSRQARRGNATDRRARDDRTQTARADTRSQHGATHGTPPSASVPC